MTRRGWGATRHSVLYYIGPPVGRDFFVLINFQFCQNIISSRGSDVATVCGFNLLIRARSTDEYSLQNVLFFVK